MRRPQNGAVDLIGPDGKAYPSVKIGAKALGVSYSGIYKHMNKGSTFAQAVISLRNNDKTANLRDSSKPITGPDGTVYPSLTAGAKAYGVSRSGVSKCLAKGMTFAEAVKTIKENREKHGPKTVKLANGEEYETLKDLCAAYGQDPSVVRKKLRRGMTLEEALKRRTYEVVDNKGVVHESIKKACDDLGLPYMKMIKLMAEYDVAFAQAQGLVGSEKDRRPGAASRKRCEDHNGRKFDSIDDLCKFYGITKHMFDGRRKKGWDLETILTTPPLRRPGARGERQCADPLTGKEYPSAKALCEAYGIDTQTYTLRVRKGADPAETIKDLVDAKTRDGVKIRDYMRRSFKSNKDAYDFYRISKKILARIAPDGFVSREALIETLKTKTAMRHNIAIGPAKAIRHIDGPYFEASIDGENCVMHIDTIYELAERKKISA